MSASSDNNGAVHHIHWRAVTLMVGSLLAGSLLAIGHHVFYATLQGQPAPADDYNIAGWDVSKQQVNIAAATALAFLVKSCLVTAVATAFAQLFWKAILGRETTLSTIDTASSLLGNIADLFKVHVLWRYPGLFLLALIAWLIPVATVFPPATLTITQAPVDPPRSDLMRVPYPAFESLQFSVGTYPITSGYVVTYAGPSFAVKRVAQSVAAQGAMLPLTSPGINASFSITLPGPRLRCASVDDQLTTAVQQNIWSKMVSEDCKNIYPYLAWTPGDNSSQNMPFILGTQLRQSALGPMPVDGYLDPRLGYYTNNGTALATRPEDYNTATYGSNNSTGGIATILVAIHPNVQPTNTNKLGNCRQSDFGSVGDTVYPLFGNATVLECSLYNTTYDALFSFNNGVQDIQVNLGDVSSERPVETTSGVGFPVPVAGQTSMLSPANPLNLTDPRALQHLSYQAVMEAFGQQLVGAFSIFAFGGEFKPNPYPSVFSTILLETEELAFLQKQSNGWENEFLISDMEKLSVGLTYSDETRERRPLQDTLEELFQNTTLSMLSSAALQPNASSPYAPPLTKVTFNEYHNVYAYAETKLWLAYGLAIAFSLVAVVVGGIGMLQNGSTFTTTFSTIFRVARQAHMSTVVAEQDANGSDPLPKYLADAKVMLRHAPRSGPQAGHGKAEYLELPQLGEDTR